MRKTAGRAREQSCIVAAGLTAFLVAVAVATQMIASASLTATILPLGVVGIAAVAAALYWRFELFVLGCLVVRASLDISKSGRSLEDSGPDIPGLLALVFLVSSFVWLWGCWRAGTLRRLSPLLKASVTFLAAAAISIAASISIGTSLTLLAKITAAVAMLWVLENLIHDEASARRVLVAAALATALPISLGLVQLVTGQGQIRENGFGRILGTFVHPNPYAIFLAVAVVMAVALIPHLQGRPRAAAVVVLVVGGIALLGTYTRGSWIAAAIGAVVVGILQSKRTLLVLIVVAAAAAIVSPTAVARFTELAPNQSYETRGGGNSVSWRGEAWSSAIRLARESPVIGIGLDMVRIRSDEAQPPHNDWVRAYSETGLLGLLAFGGLVIAFARTAIVAVRRAPQGIWRGFAVGYAGMLVALLSLTFSANVISQVVILWYVFALSAVAIFLGRRLPRSSSENDVPLAELIEA